MRPTFAMNNPPNLALSHAKASPYFRLRNTLLPKGAYLQNVIRTQFCRWMGFARATSVAAPAFCQHVMHVIGFGSEKEMIPVATPWVVTLVEYPQSVWYRPNIDFIGNAMSINTATVYIQSPITVSSLSLPGPALVCASWRDILIEALQKRLARVVSFNKNWLPTWESRLSDWLPAAALTKFWGLSVRGMICHVNKLLSAFDHAAGHFAMSLRQLYWGCYWSNYSVCGLKLQSCCPPEEIQ